MNIPFTFIVDRDYFGSSFPTVVTDIILTSVNSECTVGGSSIRFYPINAAEVTASTVAEYGAILTITDNVQFTYSGSLSPGSHNCNFSIQLEPIGRNHQVSDFFSTSVIYQPGMIYYYEISSLAKLIYQWRIQGGGGWKGVGVPLPKTHTVHEYLTRKA